MRLPNYSTVFATYHFHMNCVDVVSLNKTFKDENIFVLNKKLNIRIFENYCARNSKEAVLELITIGFCRFALLKALFNIPYYQLR